MRRFLTVILCLCLCLTAFSAVAEETDDAKLIDASRAYIASVFPALSLPDAAEWTVEKLPDAAGWEIWCVTGEGIIAGAVCDETEDGSVILPAIQIPIAGDAGIMKIWAEWNAALEANDEGMQTEAIHAEYSPIAVDAMISILAECGFDASVFDCYADILNTDGTFMILLGHGEDCDLYADLTDIIVQEYHDDWNESMGNDIRLRVSFAAE